MKFAFLLSNLAGGGAEKAVLKTAQALLARGHQVTLVLLEESDAYVLPVGLNCLRLGKKASHGWLGKRLLARRLASCVRTLSPDLLVSTLPFADEVATLARLPRHCCRIANTLSAEIARLQVSSPAKAARRLARYRSMYGQRPLIAVSEGVALDLQEKLGLTAPITTIANPFDFTAIRQQAQQDATLPDVPFVVHVGRFSAQKRHDLLLDAWQRVESGHVLYLLSSPDPQLQAMIDVRALAGRVIIAGFQQNPYPWMAAADLLVLCSDHEGLPNVLIEALICGTPVVSTDCPSGPREILGTALPGALVPCGDVAALAAAIQSSLARPPAIEALDLGRYDQVHAVAAYERLAEQFRRAL